MGRLRVEVSNLTETCVDCMVKPNTTCSASSVHLLPTQVTGAGRYFSSAVDRAVTSCARFSRTLPSCAMVVRVAPDSACPTVTS